MKPTVIDLFCGAGGLSEGFRQAGFTVVAGGDIDPDALATYAHNFPEAQVIHGDIRTGEVRGRVLEAAAGCDVVVGGPPCQAFSQVRNHTRLIDDPRNRLYREFVWTVRATRPRFFLMENVPGLAQLGFRKQVEQDLALDGAYEVFSNLVDAVDYGVPQTRKRLLFVGVRTDLALSVPDLAGTGVSDAISLVRSGDGYAVSGPLATMSGAPGVAQLEDPDELSAITVEQAIGDLALLEAGRRNDAIFVSRLGPPTSAYQRLMREGGAHLLTNVQVPRINKDTVLRLDAIPEGGNHRDLPESHRKRYLTGQKWGPSNGSGRLGRRHYYAYRRLHRGMWAWTLNTKADSAYHYSASRALSVREFARLQSFPDRFTFTTDPRRGALEGRISGGPAHSRYRQVGNAVPPLLARRVAHEILALIEESAVTQSADASA